MKKLGLKVVALMLAMMFVLTACGGGGTSTTDGGKKDGAKTGKILKTNNSSEPASLDPAKAQGTHESWILRHLFEGMMKYNEKDELVPAVAEKIDVSQDGLNYKFTMKKDIKWSDGKPVTAHDFEFAWKRVLDPKTASEYAYQLYYVKGGEEYNKGTGKVEDVAIKATDDYTLEVTLKVPTAFFKDLTAFYTLFPVEKAVAEKNPDWAKKPETYVSNGAFKLTEWAHKSKVKVAKNENYYDKDKVKLDGIDFDLLEDKNTEYQKYIAGEYDVIVSPQGDAVAKGIAGKDKELTVAKDLGVYYFNLNSKQKPFGNAKVRNALSMALDRKSIVDNVSKGGQIPAQGVVPFGLVDDTGKDFREANGKLIVENVAEAKKLLEEGLKEEGMSLADMNGKVLLYNTNEGHKKIAQAVQEMWKKNLGFEIKLENTEFKVKLDREKKGDFAISRAGWLGDFKDPMTFMDLWLTTSSFNDAKYASPEYDKLVNAAKNSPDNKVRMDSMKEAEKLIMKDMPIVPIYFYTQPYFAKSNVKGIFKNITEYPSLINADIENK